MNLKKVIVMIGICAACAAGHTLYAQQNYRINEGKDINMKLSGSSTLHKWAMNSPTFAGDAQFEFKPGTTQLSAIRSLTFSLIVLNLKSNEKGLDKNAYKALKTDQYKNITYRLTSSSITSAGGGRYLVKAVGNLSIAGVTRGTTMDVYCTVNVDGTISCTGSDNLKMSEFQVKPPSFMGGAMKTGNDIALDFRMVYRK